jgi:aspartate aminotransferase-like enzyme
MSLRNDIDPDGLLEYSVVFSDRSLNHMSQLFQQVMLDISSMLKKTYNAEAVSVVPGGGTFSMESVARQFAKDNKCLVIRNGWFSYRWSQILAMGDITSKVSVLKAQPIEQTNQPSFAPPPIESVVEAIRTEKPRVVFAPHVETSAGMILPDEYIKAVGLATHSVGGLFVLDCIASGTIWVDMVDCGVDILISAPQKGWSSSPCAGLVMLNQRALGHLEATTSNSFACDLKKWLQIMQAYENGGHAYHATMPTDALTTFRNTMKETENYGLDKIKERQQLLGDKVRTVLTEKGFKSVAAEGFQAPGVVVSYTDNVDIQSGKKFAEIGLQIAAGVPLQCGEPKNFQTFRLGLFGLDKLHHVDRTVNNLKQAIGRIAASR